MPSILVAPVLQVDANVIHKVDTSNPQNLFSMWTVFARCADSVAQGRRLENLSWRLWTRETFCVDDAVERFPSAADSLAASSITLSSSPSHSDNKDIPRRSQPSTEEMPRLSGSVESANDDEAVDLNAESDPVEFMRPHIRRQDSCGSNRSRGRERHITSDDFEKMVVSIVQDKETLKSPLPERLSSLSFSEDPMSGSTESIEPMQLTDANLDNNNNNDINNNNNNNNNSNNNNNDTESAEAEAVQDTEMAASSSAETLTTEPAEPDLRPQPEHDHLEAFPALEEMPSPTTVVSPPKRETIVTRGFSPSQVPIIAPTASLPQPQQVRDDTLPEPTSSPQAKPVQTKKATFALGGSSSCDDSMSDPSQSLEMRKATMAQMMKRKSIPSANVAAAAAAAAAAESSRNNEEGGIKSALHSSIFSRNNFGVKKQASFSSHVMTQTIPAVAQPEDSQSDSDDIDESAIDDDDDDESDWEDSNEESRRSSMDDKTMFQRVDSRVHLPSRRSLITLMIQRSEKEVKNGLTTSQSTMALPRTRSAHQPPSLAPSPPEGDDLMMRHRSRNQQSRLRPINEVPRSAAQPILAAANGAGYQAALSPRTNRRNMLSTELTESLRRHLLWERSQKTSTANAVLKRRHTSHDVANLRQYPEPVHMNNDRDDSNFDMYFNRDALNGYHAKGW